VAHSHRLPHRASPAQFDDYRWLVAEGAGWIAAVAQQPPDPLRRIEWLRDQLPAERSRLVMEQIDLRRRAAAKFADADRRFYTPIGLEQATDAIVAAYKASRPARGEPVADLCCGIGGDLVALAERGPVTGIERDPIVALLAEANLRASGVRPDAAVGSTVRVADVAGFSAAGCSAWHIDPDRRPGGRRTTRVELHEPGPTEINRLRRECPAGAIKLAPAAVVPEHWSAEAELEWIGRDRECRQLVVWFGELARSPGLRRATLLGTGPDPLGTLTGQGTCPLPAAEPIGRYVFDPEAAPLAAGLLGELSARYRLAPFSTGCAYLTGDRPISDAMLAGFEVLEALPLDVKRLARMLRERHVGRLEIKKRGVPLDPEALRRRLNLRGDEAAVVILAPQGRSTTAIIARRCAAAG
jgi:SAM-dependent methyltransferase